MKIYTHFFLLIFTKLNFTKCVNQQSNIFPFGMNVRNSVMSGIQDLADFAVNIHPPHEDPEETLASLDGVMMLENAQRRADNEEFTEAEQRLLKIHRNKIREIVSLAFEPIHAMFPSRMESFIRNEI
ncbi:hypothetical protein TpMuguga_04g00815 [Theileria parva strain Muguga]|uniref:uncharacterized protein n=1 Tax=Theileria parva strain Muguga TaxID=333668 RepID=UPI001C61F8F9|nr:uncharacterized protein TpMuguga_04g00815 [Theileria parva strain Muguga]EAN32169.2 hypothetical protein TpMuguga_04g00815 [Theileria parva strain Muguga]